MLSGLDVVGKSVYVAGSVGVLANSRAPDKNWFRVSYVARTTLSGLGVWRLGKQVLGWGQSAGLLAERRIRTGFKIFWNKKKPDLSAGLNWSIDLLCFLN